MKNTSVKKRLWRGAIWVFLVLVICFAALWVAGPKPVEMGPYVQNVTANSAEICWFGETPRRIEVWIDEGKPVDRTIESPDSRSAQRIRVGDLRAGTAYEYGVRDFETKVQLDYGVFRTPPITTDSKFTFAAVGDSGKTPRWFKMHRFGWERIGAFFPKPKQWEVGRWMAAKQPDLFIHLGDVIYSHDQLPAYDEVFFRPFADVIRSAASVVTLGNHDMHRWEHPEFFRLFHGPKPLDPGQGHKDFSHTFTWGAVRFLVLDAFWQKWGADSPMRAWLVETLKTNTLPRTIVIMHHPAFTDEAGAAENEVIQKNLWPLFVKHGVDLILSGDSHNYQRFRPIDGVTQVVVGTGGKSIRPVAPKRLAHHEERFGFLLVTVDGTSITGEFWAGEPQPLDRFTLPK